MFRVAVFFLLLSAGAALAADPEKNYAMQVVPPGNWRYWLLVPESNIAEATSTFVFQADSLVNDWLKQHLDKPGFIKVDSGTTVLIVDSERSNVLKVSVNSGTESAKTGWIDARALELTAGSIIEKGIDDAKDAERERLAALQAKKKAQSAALARAQSEAAARAQADAQRKRLADIRRAEQEYCSSLYANTADKKLSNLTVKEEQQVRSCQAAGMYFPK